MTVIIKGEKMDYFSQQAIRSVSKKQQKNYSMQTVINES